MARNYVPGGQRPYRVCEHIRGTVLLLSGRRRLYSPGAGSSPTYKSKRTTENGVHDAAHKTIPETDTPNNAASHFLNLQCSYHCTRIELCTYLRMELRIFKTKHFLGEVVVLWKSNFEFLAVRYVVFAEPGDVAVLSFRLVGTPGSLQEQIFRTETEVPRHSEK